MGLTRIPAVPFVPSHGVPLGTMGQGTGILSHSPWEFDHGTPWDKKLSPLKPEPIALD